MLFGPGPLWCEEHPQTNKKAYLFFLIPAHSHLTAHSVSTMCAMLSTMHGSSSSQLYDWTHWDKKWSEPQLPQLCSHGQWGWGVEWGGVFPVPLCHSENPECDQPGSYPTRCRAVGAPKHLLC